MPSSPRLNIKTILIDISKRNNNLLNTEKLTLKNEKKASNFENIFTTFTINVFEKKVFSLFQEITCARKIEAMRHDSNVSFSPKRESSIPRVQKDLLWFFLFFCSQYYQSENFWLVCWIRPSEKLLFGKCLIYRNKTYTSNCFTITKTGGRESKDMIKMNLNVDIYRKKFELATKIISRILFSNLCCHTHCS